MQPKPLHKAAFFDRDGTLIQEVNYLSRLEQVQVIDRAMLIARLCADKGYRLFVITNQSGVARGMFDEAFVQATHRLVAEQCVAHGVLIEKFYYCPHHPTEAVHDHYRLDCACRKPKPGMLQAAAQEFDLDLQRSVMFGDKQVDLDAGQQAGCQTFDITKLFAVSLEACTRLVQALP
jgi:D-glycero-D-manno-heptose 1,7-bisphosphate phosphatase